MVEREHRDGAAEPSREISRISMALHDLCQPLTTLQCRLELAEMIDTPEGYREAVQMGLAECSRAIASVSSMREVCRQVAAEAQSKDAQVLAKRTG